MQTHFIEATNDEPDGGAGMNWGKFLVGKFDEQEWEYKSAVDVGDGWVRSLLKGRGWSQNHIFVLDLQTGEGGMFGPWGLATADLDKHKIWVCPLFEPFLTWLYMQDTSDITKLPTHVHLVAGSALSGYRRKGSNHQ